MPDPHPSAGDGAASPSPDVSLRDAPTPDDLGRIRELLFGREMSDVDRRFAALEARQRDAEAAVRDEVSRRLDALEAYVKDELASLNSGLATERRERERALEQATAEGRAAREALSGRVRELQDAGDKGAQAVRERILEESARAQDAIATRADELLRQVERRAAALDDRKTDRAALAAIFARAAAALDDA